MTFRTQIVVALAGLLSLSGWARATETENLGLRILPAPKPVVIDGKADEWDLSGGVFSCGNVETQRETCATWVHAMYDAQNLYVLARWIDTTPLNNPGSVKGSNGFNGDCLQFRVIAGNGAAERVSHWTCWRDVDGLDAATAEYGKKFNEGNANLKTAGGAQAFTKNTGGHGYVQEIALPWKLVTKDGTAPKAGERIQMTVELNFTIAGNGRLTAKDLFKAGVTPDRVFTFMTSACWGTATIEAKGHVDPAPVRLSDTREFAVKLQDGLPAVDWTGLIQSDEPTGFKPIKFSLPTDGYVSLNLYAPDGTVARQLLTCAFYTKGEHEVKWDGLGTPSFKEPAKPVPAGDYRWEGIFHTGIGLRLRGWADAGDLSPWGGWGGDHGNPISAASDSEHVYLGWDGGEGSKPLMALDADGKVLWKNIRGGIADARLIASDGKTVYVFNSRGQYAPVSLYRLDAQTGKYSEWSKLQSTDLSLKSLLGETAVKITQPSGLAAGGGKVFASVSQLNTVLVIDADSGELIKKLNVPSPGAIVTRDGAKIWVVSNGNEVVSLGIDGNAPQSFVKPELVEKSWIASLAMDSAGNLYAGVHGGDSQVQVYSPDGKLLRTIGRKGGRVQVGAWNPDGLLDIAGLAIDPKGKLWVAENNGAPRRVSVWDSQTAKFITEYLGPTSYGAPGGVIDPVDPNLMVGQGVEWRLDPTTGKGSPVQYVTTQPMANSRYGFGPDRRLYLATTIDSIHGINPVSIYERKSDSEYKLRTVIRYDARGEGKNKTPFAVVWSDENDDAQEQPGEVHEFKLPDDYSGWITGWYMPMTADLTFYGSQYPLKVAGWTACGAPRYDFSAMTAMPAPKNLKTLGGMGAQKGHGSADNRLVLYNGGYAVDHATFDCYDLASGKLMWQYPNTFTGVHGSHRAPGPMNGLIRGAYDIVGSATLPAPVGNIWVIPTNKGEWHVLTEKGFYLTHLFQSDPMKWDWPEKPVPGTMLDNVPPGAGEEAFGGSITMGVDGKLYVECGHTSFWNLEVTGLETIKPLAESGTVTIDPADLNTSQTYYAALLQSSAGTKRVTVKKTTPAFTGDLAKDFASTEVLAYQKQSNSSVQTAAVWDEKNLYVAWAVQDDTPWINTADAPEFMYARGDTVDLQLGTDPAASPSRKTAGLGDLRLSIGNFQGKPTAVVYRLVAKDKHPKTFSSGVVKAYPMDSVTVLRDATIQVKIDKAKKRYVIEAAIPQSELGLHASDGLKLRGDFGVTHSDKAGGDTVLRTYWNNQDTGIVSDEVYELQMMPANWGELQFGR